MLIDNGANIEAKDNDGFTPLLCAIENDNIDTTKLLIEMKANIEANTDCDETPLILTSDRGTHRHSENLNREWSKPRGEGQFR